MISVFISHNYMDKPLARKISKSLNHYGIKTWIDESEIKIGDSLIAKIRAGIDKVDFIIALISKNSVESEWVTKELDIAINKEIEGKKVVVLPILAGKCELPGFLKGKLYLDMSTTRNYTQNLPQLLARFNVENILPEKELVFTSKEKTLVDIFQILYGESIQTKIDLWKSLSYSDRQIFLLDEFRIFLREYIQKETLNDEELVEVLKTYDRCASKENILDDYSIMLLDKKNQKVLVAVINSISIHGVTSEIVINKIMNILKKTTEKKVIIACLQYFYSNYIGEEREELLDACNCLLESELPKQIFSSVVRVIFYQFSDDVGIRRIIKLWAESGDERKCEIIRAFAYMGTELELTNFYIRSPRLRDEFKKMIIESISEEDDLLNADIICTLFITDELMDLFPRNESWDIVNGLDNYSVLAFLEKLNYDYNVTHIFNTIEDVIAFKEMLMREDTRISEQVFEILSNIQLKAAIDILIEYEYVPKYYNVDSIIMTLLKEVNIKEYKEFYYLCRKVRMENCDVIQRIVLMLCDYMCDNSNETELINSLQIDLGKVDLMIRERKSMLKFVCDIFDKNMDSFEEDSKKALKQFIRKAVLYYEKN